MNKTSIISSILIAKINLQLFSASEATLSPNKTSQNSMSPSMKTFYDTALLENARDVLIFDQFAEHQKIHGNSVEFRKFDTFPLALTPITEGVTPTGQSFGMTRITADTTQHGDYVTITDRLEYEAYDDIIYGATTEMGAAGGKTKDVLTRNVITAGNSVAYAPTSAGVEVTSRAGLSDTCLLTPALINRARTWLVKNNAPKINGWFVCILHPSVAEDFRNSTEWKEYHKYNDTAPIFKGEIGEMHGFRFIESNLAKVHDRGANNKPSYDTLCFGAKAFGVVEPENESMRMIIKDKKEIGGPLDLYSTIGYKFSHAAVILYQERLLRIESCSSYSDSEN